MAETDEHLTPFEAEVVERFIEDYLGVLALAGDASLDDLEQEVARRQGWYAGERAGFRAEAAADGDGDGDRPTLADAPFLFDWPRAFEEGRCPLASCDGSLALLEGRYVCGGCGLVLDQGLFVRAKARYEREAELARRARKLTEAIEREGLGRRRAAELYRLAVARADAEAAAHPPAGQDVAGAAPATDGPAASGETSGGIGAPVAITAATDAADFLARTAGGDDLSTDHTWLVPMDPAGAYTLVRGAGDGEHRVGELDVEPKGASYVARWRVDGESRRGFGVVVRDCLALAMGGGDGSWPGVVCYRRAAEGGMAGVWALPDGREGRDVCMPLPGRPEEANLPAPRHDGPDLSGVWGMQGANLNDGSHYQCTLELRRSGGHYTARWHARTGVIASGLGVSYRGYLAVAYLSMASVPGVALYALGARQGRISGVWTVAPGGAVGSEEGAPLRGLG